MLTLQLLMGSPMSFNLRNLIWHGFVGCAELDPSFASSLLLICSSIGRNLLVSRKIAASALGSIATRPLIAFSQSETVLRQLFPLLGRDDDQKSDQLLLLTTQLIAESRAIGDQMKHVWLLAVEHYRRGDHGRCCAVLVPQMENLLRFMFCVANNCPQRVLTAESVHLYTTLDEILSDKLNSNNSANQIKELLGNEIYWAVRDIFLEPEGPRIRDRLSHAQCHLSDISKVLSDHLLNLSTGLLLLLPPPPPLLSLQVASTDADGSDSLLISARLLNYKYPVFDSISVLARQITSTLSAIEICTGQPLPDLQTASIIAASSNDDNFNTTVSDTVLVDIFASLELPIDSWPILTSWMHDPFGKLRTTTTNSHQQLISYISQQWQCWPRRRGGSADSPLVNFATCRQIAREIHTAVDQLTCNLRAYRLEHETRQLRSRQRATYGRLVVFCAAYMQSMQLALLWPLVSVLTGWRLSRRQLPLNRAASFAQNASSLGRADKNRWLQLADHARRLRHAMTAMTMTTTATV